jgi:hypothetical protein
MTFPGIGSVMEHNAEGLNISEKDLKEIFALFTSCSKYEREQIYDTSSSHFLEKEDLCLEYSLSQEKREFALDAWRAVIAFMNKNGYSAYRDGVIHGLSFIEDSFIG